MESGCQGKRSQRVGLSMICSSVSFDSCQCCCLTLGSMWWGVSKGSNSSLSSFCAGFRGMSTFWSMSSNGNTSRAVILEPAWFSSYLLHLGDLIGRRGGLAALWLHLVSRILHRAAFNLSSCSEPSAIPVVTSFATSFRGVCNRNVVWIFCDCYSGNL